MILKKLSLRSFRQYRQADVEFQTGITAIVGANGSGKSTILEAVSWALYGKQRDVKETLKHLWSTDGGPTSVAMEFSIGDRDYRVERTLNNATLSDLAAGDEPKTLATGLDPVSTQSERLLHLTYEQFKNSFSTEQKSLDFLDFRTPNRQREEVARMLGYDRLRVAAKTARDFSTKKKAELEGVRRAMPDIDALQEQLKERKRELGDAEKNLKEAGKRLEAADKAVQILTPQKEKAEKAIAIEQSIQQRADFGRKLKESLQSLEKDLENHKKLIQRRDELKPKADEYEKQRKLLDELQARQAEAEKRRGIENLIADKQARVKALEEELTVLPEADLKKLEEAEKGATTNLDEARGLFRQLRETHARKLADAQQALALAAREFERLAKAVMEAEQAVKDGKCPTCKQPLPDGKLPELPELQKQLEQSEKALAAARLAADEAKTEPQELANEQGAIQQLEKARSDAAQAVTSGKHTNAQRAACLIDSEKLLKEIESHCKELKALPEGFDRQLLTESEKRVKTLKPQWEEFKGFSNIEQRMNECETKLKQEKEEFEKERLAQQKSRDNLEKLGIYGDAAKKILQEFAEAEKTHELRVEVAQLQGARDTCASAAETTLKAIETGAEMRKQADELESEYRLLDEVSKGLEELRNRLNSEARPELESYAGAILGGLTAGRYSQIKLNERFEPTVVDDSVEKKVISGGEEDVVALSLRLALSQMIQQRSGQPMSLLILDEVFGSLDPDRRQSVLERLDSLRDMVEQILIISHIESINEAADRCLTVRYDPELRCSFIEESAIDAPLAKVF